MSDTWFESNAATVVAADSSPIVLHGLDALIGGMEGFTLIACCLLPETVTKAVLSGQARILILGAGMPAISILSQIRSAWPHCAAMIISDGLGVADILHARLLGASAVLTPTASIETIRTSLLKMRDQPLKLQGHATGVYRDPRLLPGMDGLSTRQIQIAHLVANGMSNRQIAMVLGISPGTVKVHVHDIFSRLGLQSRTQLAVLVERSQPSATLPLQELGQFPELPGSPAP